MCGITGWITEDPTKKITGEEKARLDRMCAAIAHRGPDDQGTWTGAGAALGMRRLSVIDLKTGDQPVWSSSGSVLAVMNGEIYNFREIRREWEKKGYRVRTNSDTEVIPHLYDEFGDDLVDHLDGMFAFALCDKEKKRLLAARDRFGEKPFYYAIVGGSFFFASELKSLLAHPSIEGDLDHDSLFQYLSFDYVPAPYSRVRGIMKFPSGHRRVGESGRLAVDRYWNISFLALPDPPDLDLAAKELLQLITESVERRLISDVPLGVLLSGGIDSSTIAALAARSSERKIKTFSIGFEEDSFDVIALIYAHFPAELKSTYHFQLSKYLKHNGIIIFEAFSKI